MSTGVTLPAADKPDHQRPEHPDFWCKRFAEGTTPWDAGGVPPEFAEFTARQPAPLATLIPGCGSAWEAAHLARLGWPVTALDFSAEAVARARALLGNAAVDLACADFFTWQPVRAPELIYERAFLCALEAGRREILARAYVDYIIAAQAKPTAAEATRYIAEHPQLFAERRIFNIQEIILPATSNLASTLREMLNSGKSMEEIASWLKSKDVKFAGNSATRAAEQIPLELLPKVQALKDGKGLVLENGQTITVMRLVASQAVPVSESLALPRVQQFLGNQRASEAVSNDFRQLKAKADISYKGEFVEEAAAAAAKPALAAPVPAPKTLSPSIEKGVAGLK